jgi:hypothetical protein
MKYKTCGLNLEIHCPTLQLKYQSCDVYSEFFEIAQQEGLFTEQEMLELLEYEGYWSQEDTDMLEAYPKQIERLKIGIFNSIFNKEKLDKLRKQLRDTERKLSELQDRQRVYDYLTAHGVANFAKWQFIIHNTVFLDGKLFDWSVGSSYHALNHYYGNIISENVIREIAHTQPWESIWQASKHSGSVFTSIGVDMTTDQQRLICWSDMYDNIRECPDRPIQRVIDDDDMLDGWLILEKHKRQAEEKKRFNENKFQGVKGEEVFIPAQSQEEAKEIMSLNTATQRNTFSQRIQQIKNAGGQLKEGQLFDVRQKQRAKAGQLYREAVRGRLR